MCLCNRATGFSAVAVAVTAGVVMLQIRSKQANTQARKMDNFPEVAAVCEANLSNAEKIASSPKAFNGTPSDSLETTSMEDSSSSLGGESESDSFSDHVAPCITNDSNHDQKILMISGNTSPSKGAMVEILNVSLLTEATEATTDEDSCGLWSEVTTFIGRHSRAEVPLIERFVL